MNPSDAAFRRQLVQEAETGSLAELALSKYDEGATRAEQEAARSDEEQQRIRERWATDIEAKMGPKLTVKLASNLGINPDHPALTGLSWYIDRDELAKATFSTPPGVVTIASKAEFEYANLYADVVSGVLIEAAPWGESTKSAEFYIAGDSKGESRKPFVSLADLGRAIAAEWGFRG